MSNSHDFDLRKPVDEPASTPPTGGRPSGVWVAIALLIVAAGAAIYIVFGRQPRQATPAPTANAARPAQAPPASLGDTSEPISLPPLDETDPLVRRLVRTLSSNPTVAAWLATNGLIRNFVVVVVNAADGTTPAKHLKVLRPSVAFRVSGDAGREAIDSESYRRYDALADAVASIDPGGAARLYGTLKPRIEDAATEMGYSDHQFDRVFERAIVGLLKTPVVNGPIRLRPKGIGYAYADDRLEGLTGVQKQLLRMGPENVQRIEAKLREIGTALGIKPSALSP